MNEKYVPAFIMFSSVKSEDINPWFTCDASNVNKI